MDRKNLNEEKYLKIAKNLTLLAILILIIGLSIGGFLIYKGIVKPGNKKVEELKTNLESKRLELESKGIKYNVFAEYTDGEEYDLKIITRALDPSSSYCKSDEYKNNSITKDYCAAKNSTSDFVSQELIAIGIFICFITCTFAILLFTIAKGRQILAFKTQQVMPIAKEGIEEITPTIEHAAGEIAKSVSTGIKEGKSSKTQNENDK